MSYVTKVGGVERGTVYSTGGKKFVVVELQPDEYGDASWAAGLVVMEQDYQPFHSYDAAYAHAERLADR